MYATIRRAGYDVLGVGREVALDGDATVVHVTGEGLQEISNIISPTLVHDNDFCITEVKMFFGRDKKTFSQAQHN